LSSGSRIWLLLLGIATGSAPTVGCHRRSADNATQSGQPAVDSAKQSMAALRKQFDDLQRNFADLGKQVEQLPPELPGYPQLRGDYYAFEEARGVTDAKVSMLSGRLDAALRSGQADELAQVAQEIGKAQDDGRRISDIYVKLLHQTMAYRRLADQRQDARRGDAPPAPAGPNGASKKRL
jgi:hypothetical protein